MKRYCSIIAAVIALCTVSCSKMHNSFPHPEYSLETSTKMGGRIVKGAEGYFGHIKSDAQKNLAPGVSLLDISYLNMNGYAMQMYIYEVSLEQAQIEVCTPNAGTSLGTVRKLSEQANALNESVTVLGAINGDSYVASTFLPTGIMYKNGTSLKGTFSDATGGYIAIMKDGTAHIGTQSDFSSYKKNIKEAIGTKSQILKDGYVLPASDTKAAARTAVAVSEDGMKVWMIVVDGVYFYYSNGITYDDLAKVMIACGASCGVVLQSGDETTLVTRDEKSDPVMVLKNLPSNKGLEQNVVNGLAITQY